jgi:hypothetical protein
MYNLNCILFPFQAVQTVDATPSSTAAQEINLGKDLCDTGIREYIMSESYKLIP